MSDFSGLTKLAADLGKASADVTVKASRAVRKAAFDVESGAKARVPVDTGNLKNSITTSTSASGLSAEIGPTANYGIYVELGTRRMAPKPYLGPAVEAVEPGFIAAIEHLGGQILD